MKKILTLVLAALMLVSAFCLASCNKDELKKLDGKTPEALYQATQEKLKGKDNYTMVSSQKITLTAEGQEMVVNQSVTAKMAGKNSYAKIDNDMEASASMEVWYVDEMYYGIQNGKKIKAPLSWETYEEEYLPEGSTSENALLNIPDTWFKDLKFKRDGDNYYLEFLVSGEEYTKYLGEFSQFKQAGVEIGDVSYKVYFDKDANLGDVITEFDYTVSGVSAHALTKSVISDIDQTEVTAPEGGESWTSGNLTK